MNRRMKHPAGVGR